MMRPPVPQPRDGLHIVVGAGPRPEAGIAHEVRLLKAALLYADRVTLCSTRSSMYMRGLRFRDLTFDEQLHALPDLIKTVATPAEASLMRAAIAEYTRLSSAGRRTRAEAHKCQHFRDGLIAQFSKLVARTSELATEDGAAGLLDALGSGLVQLHPLNPTAPVDVMVDEFIAAMSGAITSGTSYPLLDDATGRLIDAMVREGMLDVTEGARLRGKSAHLAAMLFNRLPLFETVPVDELLDVRRALDGPLTRFRGALLKLSDTLQAAPWDAEFPADAELLITRDIAPAVEDINAAVRENRLATALVRNAAERPAGVASGTVLGASLSLLVSQTTALPAVIATALASTVGVGLAVQAGYEQWREKQATVERQELYFYYRVGQALGQS